MISIGSEPARRWCSSTAGARAGMSVTSAHSTRASGTSKGRPQMKLTSLTVLGGLVMALTLPTAPAVFAQDDPGVPGPLDVVRAEYDFGDTDQTFGAFPYETRAVVYHPADLSTGPFPMVVFLHGWHPTCYIV